VFGGRKVKMTHHLSPQQQQQQQEEEEEESEFFPVLAITPVWLGRFG
jgi:hypothetical protein